MTASVKPDRRAERRARTEAQLVAAATELFLERGYTATTLVDVARRAGVADRTVYVRFATKADLLHRCIDVAIGGDTEAVDLGDREWMAAAMSAATLDERIDRMAAVTAMLMARSGALIGVARQAAASEPSIEVLAQAGRDQTRSMLRAWWASMADDGLLPSGCDLEWLSETGALLAHADTYLLLSSTVAWDGPTYERWLATTWRRLVVASTS